jgi:hypothetical protein
MTPLQTFAQMVTETRKVFDASRDPAAWLVFYEAKQMAFVKLVAALPQVKEIEDLWRYVQNMAPTAWLPIIEDEISRITQSKHLCRGCGAAAVTWPQRRCARCQKARRLETYQRAKKRRALSNGYASVLFATSRRSIRPAASASLARKRPKS